MNARRTIVVGALLEVLGCAAPDEGDEGDGATAGGTEDPIPIVDAPSWQRADEHGDLFAAMRPPEVDCDELRGTYLQETPWATIFEINTGWCNYVTISQPLLQPLAAGDVVEVRVYHFELTGGPAEGYLGLGVGSEIVWDETVPIPSESELVAGTFEVSADVEVGTPIQFHVHNHGSNTWEIHSIARLDSGS